MLVKIIIYFILKVKFPQNWLKFYTKPCQMIHVIPMQCLGKLLLKVMHYNIALLSKKVTNYVT